MSRKKRRRHPLHLEAKHHEVLPLARFLWRVLYFFAFASLLVGLSLILGMVGYHVCEGMGWIDAFVNASMILSGMGPHEPLRTDAGKIFAGIYALYSGLALLVATGILFTPLVHRLLHRFHIEEHQTPEHATG